MHLVPCPACSEHVRVGSCTCPHCGVPYPCRAPRGKTAAAVLLGLGLTACTAGSKETAETAVTVQPLYGVTTSEIDADGDGFTLAMGDCDDDDDAIYPGAPETAGDGVDSDCDCDCEYDPVTP
jgi:hypothetical protein